MSYELILKVFVNENLPAGKLGLTEIHRTKGSTGPSLIHMHPNDYQEFMNLLKEYYLLKEENRVKEYAKEHKDCTDENCDCKEG